MAKDRAKLTGKGRPGSGTFLALPHAVIDTAKFRSLSPQAKALLIDLGRQFTGFNNGALQMTWRRMKALGWNSTATLHKAKDELIAAGMILESRKGWKHRASLYALTWHPVDECGGILDISPSSTPPGLWRDEN